MKSCCKVFKFVFGKIQFSFRTKKSILKIEIFEIQIRNILKNGNTFEFWNMVFRDTVYVCDCPCPFLPQRSLLYMLLYSAACVSISKPLVLPKSQFSSRVSIWQPRFNLTAASPKQPRKFEKSPFSLPLKFLLVKSIR